MGPKCPCLYDKKTQQYRDCKGRSCKPSGSKSPTNSSDLTWPKMKKTLKKLVGLKKGGSVTTKTKFTRSTKTKRNFKNK